MKRDEKGYIVVETIGSFMLFTLLMVSILSLINVVTVQARIHYAITQACETVSVYSYVLDLTGASKHIQNNSANTSSVQGQIDTFKSDLNGLLDGIQNLNPEQIGTKGEAVLNHAGSAVSSAVENPKETIQYLLNYGLNEGSGALFEAVLRPLVGRYLANGEESGDTYLKNYGVINGLDGLDFYSFDATGNDSALLDAKGNIRIVVQYDIDYSFGALIIPFDEPRLHITQMVMTKAWLGGEGEGYRE